MLKLPVKINRVVREVLKKSAVCPGHRYSGVTVVSGQCIVVSGWCSFSSPGTSRDASAGRLTQHPDPAHMQRELTKTSPLPSEGRGWREGGRGPDGGGGGRLT